MKKAMSVMIILSMLLISVLTVTPAFAEEEGPHGGPYSDLMVEAFAIETGKTVAEIQALKDKGKSYLEIAQDLGYSGEELYNLLEQVGETVLDLAVKNGMITEEISDRMTQRMERITGGSLFGKFLEQLDLTYESLISMLNSGMSFHEILIEQGFEPGGHLAERCGLSRDEIISRLKAGESLREVCPGMLVPAGGWPKFNQP